jgi:hypothetical protein
MAARDWADVRANGDGLVGTTVAVRGPLIVGPPWMPAVVGCRDGCCIPSNAAATVGGGAGFHDQRGITLRGAPALACSGDESLQCCGVDAHGQEVIATGVLQKGGLPFELVHATVCVP